MTIDAAALPDVSVGPKRVLVLGATGTIGQATVAALVGRGHQVTCIVRTRHRSPGLRGQSPELTGADVRVGDVTDPTSFRAAADFSGMRYDVVVSCLASRTGVPADAWAIDYQANLTVLERACEHDVPQFILLSAICVQKPLLAFQRAKLAFEEKLIQSGMTYSIVRPTAFFKSLSGQIDRVRQGKSFLVFGDGRLTACKPISDRDLGAYLADCLNDPQQQNRILPIGGPGPAITPSDQAEMLFKLMDRKPKIRKVPVMLIRVIIATLSGLGRVFPSMKAKSELARIGHYYATESMLVLNSETGHYDAAATPSTGSETLLEFYKKVIAGEASVDRGDHAVF